MGGGPEKFVRAGDDEAGCCDCDAAGVGIGTGCGLFKKTLPAEDEKFAL